MDRDTQRDRKTHAHTHNNSLEQQRRIVSVSDLRHWQTVILINLAVSAHVFGKKVSLCKHNYLYRIEEPVFHIK